MRRRTWLAPALAALAIAALIAGPAFAERSESGGLIVFLNGGIAPRRLPRRHPAPVAVRLQAGIRTAERIPLPRVRAIRLELAWRGALDTRGLAVCSPGEVAQRRHSPGDRGLRAGAGRTRAPL